MADIVIYTKATCPYCARAKALLSNKGVSYTEYDIEKEPEKRGEMLRRNPNAKTVPQIFINDKSIGGSDSLYDLDKDGQLDILLKE